MRFFTEKEAFKDEGDALRHLVFGLTDAMVDKLETKRCEAWEGWDNPGEHNTNDLTKAGWSVEEIRARIRAQLDKPDGGDPVDIANYCAFWWDLRQEKE